MNAPVRPEVLYLEASRRGLVPGPWALKLHPAQRAWFDDQAKRKAALCGRRAGKSHAAAVWLLDGALRSRDTLSVYIALARPIAKKIMWPVLRRMDTRYGLGLDFNESELMVEIPWNHSQIWVAGCSDEGETERFRGPAYRRAVVDEVASFRPYVKGLIDDVLTPALMDHDGELALMGSPGAALTGYFYNATTGTDLRSSHGFIGHVHSWTARDNLTLNKSGDWIERHKALSGIDESDPGFQREYLGRWVRDDAALVYPYDQTRNALHMLPPEYDWQYVLGIDLGATESSAFVLVAYAKDCTFLVVTESFERPGMTPTEIAGEIKRLQSKYPVVKTVIDTGGLGRGYADEFRRHHGLSVEAAEKQQKLTFVRYLSQDVRAGRVRLIPAANSELIQEMAMMCWNADHTALDDRMPDHLLDALLYSSREARRYLPAVQAHVPMAPADPWAAVEEAELDSGTAKPWWKQ